MRALIENAIGRVYDSLGETVAYHATGGVVHSIQAVIRSSIVYSGYESDVGEEQTTINVMRSDITDPSTDDFIILDSERFEIARYEAKNSAEWTLYVRGEL